jgi:hypothetical protein
VSRRWTTTKSEKDLIDHDIATERNIFRKYATIHKKREDFCDTCRRKEPKIQNFNEGKPVSFFVVGADMKKTIYKVMFVGKVVTSNWGEKADPPDPIDRESGSIDARFNSRPLFLAQDNPFFNCIATICQSLWKADDLKEIWRKIAITDMTKCSISDNFAETTTEMKDTCLNAGFLKAEIEEIKPSHLIFFTGHDYDSQIRSLLALKHEIVDQPEREIKIWWTMPADTENKLQVLRTHHPYYIFHFKPKEKDFFCQEIADWIKSS